VSGAFRYSLRRAARTAVFFLGEPSELLFCRKRPGWACRRPCLSCCPTIPCRSMHLQSRSSRLNSCSCRWRRGYAFSPRRRPGDWALANLRRLPGPLAAREQPRQTAKFLGSCFSLLLSSGQNLPFASHVPREKFPICVTISGARHFHSWVSKLLQRNGFRRGLLAA
jgi:hypothetical protein